MAIKITPARLLLLGVSLTGLAMVYMFQNFDVLTGTLKFNRDFGGALPPGEEVNFLVNRGVRFILNDLLCILMIYALYNKPRYTLFAFYVQLFGLLVLFPVYVIVALNIENPTQYTFLVPLYRLVMNPILMILLIPAFYFQQKLTYKEK